MSDEDEDKIIMPSYFHFWILMALTFFMGWATGAGLLKKIAGLE